MLKHQLNERRQHQQEWSRSAQRAEFVKRLAGGNPAAEPRRLCEKGMAEGGWRSGDVADGSFIALLCGKV